MEHEPRPPHGELAPPSRDTQDLIIDLRAADSERADINYYEQKYGHNPELLAQNVAIAAVHRRSNRQTYRTGKALGICFIA